VWLIATATCDLIYNCFIFVRSQIPVFEQDIHEHKSSIHAPGDVEFEMFALPLLQSEG